MRLLLIVAIVAFAAFGLNAAEVAGTWKGAMETPMGKVDVTVTFQPGSPLTGKVQAGEYEAPIEKATLDGDKIHFEMNIQPGKVVYDGTVARAEMKLNVTGTQGDTYSLSLARQN